MALLWNDETHAPNYLTWKIIYYSREARRWKGLAFFASRNRKKGLSSLWGTLVPSEQRAEKRRCLASCSCHHGFSHCHLPTVLTTNRNNSRVTVVDLENKLFPVQGWLKPSRLILLNSCTPSVLGKALSVIKDSNRVRNLCCISRKFLFLCITPPRHSIVLILGAVYSCSLSLS